MSPPLSLFLILPESVCPAAKVESVIIQEGASRFSASSGGGGGRGASQHYPKTVGKSEFLGKAPGSVAQKWVPSRSTRREGSSTQKDRHDAIFRKVRGILNKLTPEKFDKLCLELLNVGIDSKVVLKGVILLIVDKALEEPKYSSLYAQLCLRLAEDAPSFDGPAPDNQPPQKQSTTFKRLLIAKLQDEFENRTKNVEVYDKQDTPLSAEEAEDTPLSAEEAEQQALAKMKMLGNIKFIGELGKLNLIHESILHKCIKTLLEKKRHVQVKDMGEDLECLCQIMRTVGPRLDHHKAKSLMDQYFGRVRSLIANQELPSRIRFLLQDTLELRENDWTPRKIHRDTGPKTIIQIRQDAVKDLGVFIPPMGCGSGSGRPEVFGEGSFLRGGAGLGVGGLADMFGQMPGGGIGTGPGVIQEEHYSPTLARHRGNGLFITPPTHTLAAFITPPTHTHSALDKGHKAFGKPSQQASQAKDLTPRFAKRGLVSAEEVSLRPAQSFLLSKNQKLQPNTPTQIPPSAQPQRTHTPPLLREPPQLGLKSAPPLIQEKPPKTKKAPPSTEELLNMTESVVRAYLAGGSVCEAVCAVREMRAPRSSVCELLAKMILLALQGSDSDRECVSTLIHTLHAEGMVTAEHYMQALLSVCDREAELEGSVPLLKSLIGQFVARALLSDVMSVCEVAAPLANGTHFPLFLLCLQQAARLRDPHWLSHTLTHSRLNIITMLPECDQSKDRMLELLEDKGLGFLFPLLRVEKELLRHVREDPSPTHIYRWIRDNVTQTLHTDPSFINILITSLLQYVWEEVCAAEREEEEEWDLCSLAPPKEALEQEKRLLDAFKPVIQKFLHEHTHLQVTALYALQTHCHNLAFPKGMLLRYFVYLYDMEVVEEEAFLAWKEDLSQEFPGKGKALFQVNQWLTWLETAEEEESEDDEE